MGGVCFAWSSRSLPHRLCKGTIQSDPQLCTPPSFQTMPRLAMQLGSLGRKASKEGTGRCTHAATRFKPDRGASDTAKASAAPHSFAMLCSFGSHPIVGRCLLSGIFSRWVGNRDINPLLKELTSGPP